MLDFDVRKQLIALIERQPLYSEIKVPEFVGVHIASWLDKEGVRVDLHCPNCNRNSVFATGALNPGRGWGKDVGNQLVLPALQLHLQLLVLKCARQPTHQAIFPLRVYIDLLEVMNSPEKKMVVTIQKIGQYPAFADLESAKFSEYANSIDALDLRELKKASGLASHDVGIGAFVYLRRIFERLLEAAHQDAKKDSGWDDDAYQRSRVDEKVKSLKGHLPSFVVENAAVYSILSKGLHELDEDTCVKSYAKVEGAVLLMLDEVKYAKQRGARLKQVSSEVSKIHTAIASVPKA